MAIVGGEPARNTRSAFRLGPWRADPGRNELRKEDGEVARLEPKAMEVLAYLAARPGEVVPREELLAAVWPGVIVGDDALTQGIIKLRKALGDDAHKPEYIETISKRGYRLIAPVDGVPKPQRGEPPRPRRRALVAGAIAAGVLVIGVLVGALVLSGSGMRWPLVAESPPGVTAAPALPTVAVLPLDNLSGDPAREYFSDGMTEDIIAALGRFSYLRVMSRAAVQAFKGKTAPPQAVREQLGARYVVQGSVREAGPRLRVAMQLSDAEKGTLLWSERYEGEGAQLFEIQDRIVRSVVGTLGVKVTQLEQQRAFTRPTASLEAHDLLLRARALLVQSDRRGNREARALLAKAQELAPDHAELLVAMGDAEVSRATYGWVEDPSQSLRRAESYAKHALAQPDQGAHVGAHTLLAGLYANLGRLDEALDHSARALALNPSDATALNRRGGALLWSGNVEEAISLLEVAKRYDPYPSVGRGMVLVVAYYTAGRHRDALAESEALLARFPQHDFLHAIRAAALAELGQVEQAAAAAERVRRLNPEFSPENFGTRFTDRRYTARLQEGLAKAGLK